MLPPQSFLDVLVIPSGATSGTRIVIDGVNGTITGYDANDDVTFELNGDDGVQVYDNGVLIAELGPDGLQVYDNELMQPAATLDTDGLTVYAGGVVVATVDTDGVRVINPFDGAYAELNPGPTQAVIPFGDFAALGTAFNTPSGLPIGSNDLEVRWVGKGTLVGSADSLTSPATYTERSDFRSTGNQLLSSSCTKQLASSAATGVQAFTLVGSGSWTRGIGITVDVPSAPTVNAQFRSVTTTTSSSASFSVAAPAGLVAGDMLLAFQLARHSTPTDPVTITVPADWVSLEYVATVDATQRITCRVFYKVAGASEPANYTFGQSASTTSCVTAMAIQSANTSGISVPSVGVYDASGNVTFYAGADFLRTAVEDLSVRSEAETSTININQSVSGANLAIRRTNGTDDVLSTTVASDTVSRLVIEANGGLHWGPGNAATDNSLTRLNSTTMEFSDGLQVDGDLSVGGDLGTLGDINTVGSINVNDGTENVTLASGVDLIFDGTTDAILDNQSGRLHLNNFTVPMGMIARFNSTSNSSAYSDGNVTDFSLTFTPVTGRLYKFCIHSQADVSVDGANWRLTIRQDGSNIMRLGQWNIDSDAEYIDSCILIPGASLDFGNSNTYDLIANNVAGGGTVTFQANTAIDRQWWVEDVGA